MLGGKVARQAFGFAVDDEVDAPLAVIEPAHGWLLKHSSMLRRLEARTHPLSELPMSTEQRFLGGHTVVIGFASLGRDIVRQLQGQDDAVVVVDHTRAHVESAREDGGKAVCGDACEAKTLFQAHVLKARCLVIAVSDVAAVQRIAKKAREINHTLRIIASAPSQEDAVRIAPFAEPMVAGSELARAMAANAAAMRPMSRMVRWSMA